MTQSATCSHEGHGYCNGSVIRWRVWGTIGRYLEACGCDCHDKETTQ